MLQINSGKFFTNPDRFIIPQQAVLFTNYEAHAPLITAAGTLTPDGKMGGVTRLVLRYDSQLERDPTNAGFQLAAVDQASYIADVGAVVAFSLNVVCQPFLDDVIRLTQGADGTPAANARRFIPRVFDASVAAASADAETVGAFIQRLIGLRRKTFLRVIRAIRRVASAAERVPSDPEIAYVMLVAAVEAVAQEFATLPITWGDYDRAVRSAVDEVLESVDESRANALRTALISTAHLKLKQKYVQFASEHLEASFFRAEVHGRQRPARRSSIPALFGGAYDIRSGHVHALEELPHTLTVFAALGEVASTDDGIAWSIAGLHRATRHVLNSFISRQPQGRRSRTRTRASYPVSQQCSWRRSIGSGARMV